MKPKDFTETLFFSLKIDDYCCGCGASLFSCLGSCPPCLGYFRHLFKERTERFIERLVSKTKPKLIIVCMIYYLDERMVPSWANASLGAMGYNRNPHKLQVYIRKLFEVATR